jgi:hypothetical protein
MDSTLKRIVESDNGIKLIQWLYKHPLFDINTRINEAFVDNPMVTDNVTLLRYCVELGSFRCAVKMLELGADPNMDSPITGVVRFAVKNHLEFSKIRRVLRKFVKYESELDTVRELAAVWVNVSQDKYKFNSDGRMKSLFTEIHHWLENLGCESFDEKPVAPGITETGQIDSGINGADQINSGITGVNLLVLAEPVITCGSADGLELLIKAGLDVDGLLPNGMTPLMHAVRCIDGHSESTDGFMDCVRKLMKAGANPVKTCSPESHVNPLSMAAIARSPNLDLIRILVANW